MTPCGLLDIGRGLESAVPTCSFENYGSTQQDAACKNNSARSGREPFPCPSSRNQFNIKIISISQKIKTRRPFLTANDTKADDCSSGAWKLPCSTLTYTLVGLVWITNHCHLKPFPWKRSSVETVSLPLWRSECVSSVHLLNYLTDFYET
jgi:hypothetical protein